MKKFLPIILFILIAVSTIARPSGFAADMGSPFLKEFAVYPNPTSGALTVTLETLNGDAPEMKIKVFSLIGQEMLSETISPFSGVKRMTLDLGKLPKGIYMIEVSDGEKSRIKRVSVI
jgi:hypothetical protein